MQFHKVRAFSEKFYAEIKFGKCWKMLENTADWLSRFLTPIIPIKCWSVTFSQNRFPDVVITPQSD